MKQSEIYAALTLAGTITATPIWAEGQITFTSYGGTYQEAQRKALLDPVEEAMDITIMEDTLTGIAEVRAQVGAGAVTSDIVDLGLTSCAAAQHEGILEPLDYSIVSTEGINPAAYDDTWIGTIYYSTVLGYSTEIYSDKVPQDWADFWDTENFPGLRSLRNDPVGSLEIALLADGVAPEDLYPIDYERAFKKLDEIKDDVAIWWTSGAQSAQLIRDGEVDMVAIWNGRLDAVLAEGAPVDFTWNQGLLSLDCLAIPKGAPNKDLAMEALGLMVSPDIAANIPQYISYGPTTSLAFDTGRITPEMAAVSPSAPENLKVQAVLSAAYWAEHMQEAQERWASWMTE
jgi:putative spermidine/putrescine transport system substrate-binding protein